MCLDRLVEFAVPADENGDIWAWKVFLKTDGLGLRLLIMWGAGSIPKGEWVDELDYRLGEEIPLKTERNERYGFGFHCFPTEPEARQWLEMKTTDGPPMILVLKIRISDIVATGFQDGVRVIVAKKMYVPEDAEQKDRLREGAEGGGA